MIKNIFQIAILFFLFVISVFIYFYISGIDEVTTEIVDNTLPRKFYLINLDRQTDRWDKISNSFKKYHINLERFSAVDGFYIELEDIASKEKFTGADLTAQLKELSPERKYHIYCEPKSSTPDFTYSFNEGTYPLTPGELGLSCSSKKLWKKIADSNEIALIFEDDVQLFGAFDRHVNEILTALPNQWDVVYLDHSSHNLEAPFFMKHVRVVNHYLLKLWSRESKKYIYDSHAYIIHPGSAKKLLEYSQTHPNLTVEEILYNAIKHKKIVALMAKNKVLGLKDIQSEIDRMGRWSKYTQKNQSK